MSREKAHDNSKNPPGFSERLTSLMEGWGYSTRELADLSGVSHGTIANWQSGKSRAGPDEVEKVAKVFNWNFGELYHGEPRMDVMTRYAELDAFRMRARRLAAEIAGTNIKTIDAATLIPVKRSSTAGGGHQGQA